MKARVNTGLLLRTIARLIKAGVIVDISWHWATRGGGAPRALRLRAPAGMIIANDILTELTKNGYRFLNAQASKFDGYLEMSFERDYVV